MGGANARVQQVGGLLLAGVALMAVLLVSLAPIAWIFRNRRSPCRSWRDCTSCCGPWPWASDCDCSARARCSHGAGQREARVWIAIYLVVCLQMMTTLRPIVGTAGTFFPHEKMFFLAHWMRVLTGQ